MKETAQRTMPRPLPNLINTLPTIVNNDPRVVEDIDLSLIRLACLAERALSLTIWPEISSSCLPVVFTHCLYKLKFKVSINHYDYNLELEWQEICSQYERRVVMYYRKVFIRLATSNWTNV